MKIDQISEVKHLQRYPWVLQGARNWEISIGWITYAFKGDGFLPLKVQNDIKSYKERVGAIILACKGVVTRVGWTKLRFF